MSIISVVYASAPVGEYIIPSVEILIPGQEPIRVCNGYVDRLLGVDGAFQLFEAGSLSIALPAKNTSGQQSLAFGIGNVNGRVQASVDAALESGAEVPLIYREYVSTDLLNPARRPLRMIVTGGSMKGGQAQFQASFYDLLNSAWPRERYTAQTAPGVRYL